MMQVHLTDQVVGQQDLLVSLDAVQRRLPHPDLDIRKRCQQLGLSQPILHQVSVAVAGARALRPDGGEEHQVAMLRTIRNGSRCEPLDLGSRHVAPDPLIEQQICKPRRRLRRRSRSGSSSSEAAMQAPSRLGCHQIAVVTLN